MSDEPVSAEERRGEEAILSQARPKFSAAPAAEYLAVHEKSSRHVLLGLTDLSWFQLRCRSSQDEMSRGR